MNNTGGNSSGGIPGYINRGKYVGGLGNSNNDETLIVSSPTTSDHNSLLGYTVAIITLGAAFGNMFLAGKIRNVMKVQVPKTEQYWKRSASSAKAGAEGGESTQHAEHHAHKQQAYQQQKQQYQKSQSQQQSGFDPAFNIKEQLAVIHRTHLRTLGLEEKDMNEKALKNAYRQLVMKYHPDRLAIDDPQREEYREKFQRISNSYNLLLDVVRGK
jgi:DnaJ-domain-containing protein 1